MNTKIIWQPQPGPQKALIDCPLPEIFYGGARGGGKTDGVLGKYAIKACTYGAGFNAVFFRKELPMLDDAIERSKEIYSQIGAKWLSQIKTWRFRGGGRLRFRPLDSTLDAEKYQGQNISDACVEEAGNYSESRAIDRLNGVLRNVHGVPTQLILTGNPGGSGQFWIKERYIDPAPKGMKILYRGLENGEQHKYVFIPSSLENNKLLVKNDPGYVNRLYLVGSAQLVKAWLSGDWSAVEGAFFDCWSNRIILDPFEVPKDWLRFLSMDWGSAKPFSIGWWAVVSDEFTQNGQTIPRGSLIRYREYYGAEKADVGLKKTAAEVGREIARRSRDDPDAVYGVADPAMFATIDGPSVMENLRIAEWEESKKLGKRPTPWKRADNTRVTSKGKSLGTMGGWEAMRKRIIGEEGNPMIYCFSTCVNSIRTIPSLQHDDAKPEDLDTKSEDHAADDWRYACMSRPWIPSRVTLVDTDRFDAWGRKRGGSNWKTN